MQYIIEMNAATMTNQPYPGSEYGVQPIEAWHDDSDRGWEQTGGWRGRGRDRGRGYGNGYGGGRGRLDDQGTDALTLAGGDEDDPPFAPHWEEPTVQGPIVNDTDENQYVVATNSKVDSPPSGGDEKTGRMQRMGDEWMVATEQVIGSEGL